MSTESNKSQIVSSLGLKDNEVRDSFKRLAYTGQNVIDILVEQGANLDDPAIRELVSRTKTSRQVSHVLENLIRLDTIKY